LVDVKESAKEHRPIVTIMGSGRLADEIAAAVLNPDWERRPEIELLLEQGQIYLLDLKEATLSLSKVLRQKLLGAE
jgi:lysine/ornithine N-monooxygenase